ncbi:MAG: flagellin lysine-N-methylase [Lachnospiraceae bacterium]|nr:flagellin lysine-N-methylase [Lachnospiraceae bacterium]
MRFVYPHYFHDFQCIADKCPDTCCAGWQIVIDDESMEHYEQYVGNFSDRLQKGIDWKQGCFKQGKNKRCSMLNDQNLCDMILQMGENHLCRTCTLYPRHEEEFEGLREWSLAISCPVAAQMVLTCEEPLHFLIEENDDDDPLIDEFDDFDFLLFTELEDAREVLYQVIQNRDLSIDDRMRIMLDLAVQLQTCVEENRISDMQVCNDSARIVANDFDIDDSIPDLSDPYERYSFLQENFSVFSKLELMREDWQEVLDAERDMLAGGVGNYAKLRESFEEAMEAEKWWPVFLENYLMTFVYTYFCGAVYDDWIDTKVLLAVISLLFTEEFIMNLWIKEGKITQDDCVKMAWRYVREVEHSDLNLNAMEEYLHAVLFSPA